MSCGGEQLKATFVNPGPNYLSVGDAPKPTVFLLISMCFGAALVSWIWLLRASPTRVHSIHRIMTVLLIVKILSVFAEAMRFHYMKKKGDSLTSWTILFYVFGFMKGMMFFLVILLIGMGWSFVKPFLSEREKRVIFLVLIMQVINNIALIALSEASEGTMAWMTWRDLLHLVDLCCCATILFPIAWSMRQLRQSADIDGKAHTNLEKLRQFRSFYLIVISYIYFTRIVVYLLAATLPYEYTWVKDFCKECAGFCFYVASGYKFRPTPDNPYLPVHLEEEDELNEFSQEFGLSDGDDEDDAVVRSSNGGIQRTMSRHDHGSTSS